MGGEFRQGIKGMWIWVYISRIFGKNRTENKKLFGRVFVCFFVCFLNLWERGWGCCCLGLGGDNFLSLWVAIEQINNTLMCSHGQVIGEIMDING